MDLHTPIDFIRLSDDQQREVFCIGLLAEAWHRATRPISFDGGMRSCVMAGIAQRERETIAQRTRDGTPSPWPANGSLR
jgi:hypothetical protein